MSHLKGATVRKFHHPTLVLLTLVFAASTAVAGEPDWWPKTKPGLWRMTMDMHGRSMSVDKCLTEDAIRHNQSAPPSGASGCSDGKYSRENDRVFVARYSCREGDVTVRVTRPNADSARIETTMHKPGKTQTMVMNMNHVGACKG
jgi:hypothetical protein